MEINHFKTAEDTLASISGRTVSHTTKITCACCGETFNISNRHKTPWEVHPIGNGLCQVIMPCARCDKTYDITTCLLHVKRPPIALTDKPNTKTILVKGKSRATQWAIDLNQRSCWFEITPLPDNQYTITTKDEGHIEAIEAMLK